MSGPDPDKLAEIFALLDSKAGTPGDEVVQLLVDSHEAVLKSGNTNTLRLAGVTGTCSWSTGTGLLASWRRNAEKRLDPAQRGPSTMPGMGHNSGARKSGAEATDANATDERLRLLVERVERLEEEKKGIADDIRDVYAEAKAVGYDTKTMRRIVALRKMDPDARREMEMVLDTYKAALGMG